MIETNNSRKMHYNRYKSHNLPKVFLVLTKKRYGGCFNEIIQERGFNEK